MLMVYGRTIIAVHMQVLKTVLSQDSSFSPIFIITSTSLNVLVIIDILSVLLITQTFLSDALLMAVCMSDGDRRPLWCNMHIVHYIHCTHAKNMLNHFRICLDPQNML